MRQKMAVKDYRERYGRLAGMKIPPYTTYVVSKFGGLVRRFPKIGRNKVCPCGSGYKYKFCCGKIGGNNA